MDIILIPQVWDGITDVEYSKKSQEFSAAKKLNSQNDFYGYPFSKDKAYPT